MNSNDLMNTLMGVLQNPDAKSKLLDTISSLSGNNGNTSPLNNDSSEETDSFNPTAQSNPVNLGGIDINTLSRVKNMLDRLGNTDDPRIGLLNSIRPYMSAGRTGNIDMAIRFIQIINFATGLKL